MTPAERIEKAFDDANVVIANYLQPGPRNPEETLIQLITILNDREVHDALVALPRVDDKRITLVAS